MIKDLIDMLYEKEMILVAIWAKTKQWFSAKEK